jgi:hypothetical protein
MVSGPLLFFSSDFYIMFNNYSVVTLLMIFVFWATASKNTHVELPPELCEIILSPISISTLYSYTFIPSIMHRLESLLIAVNLKKMHSDHYLQHVNIPSMKVIYFSKP